MRAGRPHIVTSHSRGKRVSLAAPTPPTRPVISPAIPKSSMQATRLPRALEQCLAERLLLEFLPPRNARIAPSLMELAVDSLHGSYAECRSSNSCRRDKENGH